MPRFNRIFEELGVKYNDYVIPPDVLLGLEKKKDSSKAVALAESKKRKGGWCREATCEEAQGGGFAGGSSGVFLRSIFRCRV